MASSKRKEKEDFEYSSEELTEYLNDRINYVL